MNTRVNNNQITKNTPHGCKLSEQLRAMPDQAHSYKHYIAKYRQYRTEDFILANIKFNKKSSNVNIIIFYRKFAKMKS